jgi:type IV secretory pathway protease TraF
MSDNRDNAIDSREFGAIKESAILGIVQNLTFSSRPGS